MSYFLTLTSKVSVLPTKLNCFSYSLVIKELSKTHKCNLFIGVGKKMPIKYSNHPSGNVYLDKRIVELFIPLKNLFSEHQWTSVGSYY